VRLGVQSLEAGFEAEVPALKKLEFRL